jgi:hypothetical protein
VADLTASQFIQRQQPTLFADTDLMGFYVELATSQTAASYFGTMYEYAIALRAMHNYLIDRDRPDGEAGLITGKSEGSASIRYWNKVEKGRYSDLQLTHYGQRLLALIKSRGPSISVVGDANNLINQLTSTD